MGTIRRSTFSQPVKHLHLCFWPPRAPDAWRSIINSQILTFTSSPPPRNRFRLPSARLVFCANPPNEPPNASRTRTGSPIVIPSVPSVNFASYRVECNGHKSVRTSSDSSSVCFTYILGTLFEWVSLHGEARLLWYPSPYRFKHRFAGKSSALQAYGLGICGLAASRLDREESCLWRVPVATQSCVSIWYLRRWTRISLQARINLLHLCVSYPTLVGTLVLVPAARVPSPWLCLLGPYLIPNLRHRKASLEC